MRKVLKWVAGVVVFIVVIVMMMTFFQEKILFRSETLPKEYQFTFKTDFEELFLKAEDGAVLNGLHFKQPNPKGVILYCHGNKRELDYWGNWAKKLSNTYNYDVVIWDYRGYGKSTGKRKPKTILDDGFLFYEYCNNTFASNKITVFGRSLGGFFATHIANNKEIKALILESTGTSIEAVAKYQYGFLPTKALLKFKFQSNNNIKAIKVPTYIIHGTEDGVIPLEQGQELFTLSGAANKKLTVIEKGSHNNLRDFTEYFNALDDILK